MRIRQLLRLLMLVGICLLGTSGVYASEPQSPSTQYVIIGLRHDWSNEIGARSEPRADRRMQIRRLQDDLVARQLGTARDIWRMQTQPVIVARVDDDTLTQLRGDYAVTSVRESRLFTHLTSESSSQVGARAVHASGVTGAGTSIAIIDTGVDSTHRALQGQVIQEVCFSTTDDTYGSYSMCADGASMQVGPGSARPCDLTFDACHHGTHVAGIAAGRVINQDGITTRGIAPGAKIIAVQVFSRFDARHSAAMCGVAASADCVFAFEHDLLRALDWLYLNNDARAWGTLAAVNMSLGDGSYSEACDTFGGSDEYPFKWFIDQLRLSGVATVVAAGNGASPSGVAFPACISSAMSVGSVSSTKPVYGLRDRPSPFSNVPIGAANVPNASGDRLLDFYAPGESIRSSIATPGGSTFVEYSGTSMSAPHVAGAWALIKSLRPRASVPQIMQWLRDTGHPIVEDRSGFDASLVVPRIDVLRVYELLRAPIAPVQSSAWAIDFGDVQVGQTMRQRVTIRYRGIPTTIVWQVSGRYFRTQTQACDGFVDDLTLTCVFDVVFTPTGLPNGHVANAVVRLELNRKAYTIGLTGRSVDALPEVALTQTAQVQATTNMLFTRTATPTAWPSPSAMVRARTVIAVATRTQRRRDELALTVTHRADSLARTATQVVMQGGATYTPSATPRATVTRTPVPIVQTIGQRATATRRAVVRQTAAAKVAITRTQQVKLQATAFAVSVAKTATQLSINGLPTFTPTKKRIFTRTRTATRTATVTNSPWPTRTPTIAYMRTYNESLYKRYQTLLASPSGEYALMMYAGDTTKSFMPELTLIDPTTRTLKATLRLPGVDATALTAVVNRSNQFVVAGRLNWNSMYIQIYDVRATSFVLRSTRVHPLLPGSQVTALYATDSRVFVSMAVKTPPATLATGQLVVFDRRSANTLEPLSATPIALAGVPTSIRALDDADALIVIGGYVSHSTSPMGFLQTLRWQASTYQVLYTLARPMPVSDVAIHSVLTGLVRQHIVFVAHQQSMAILQLDEASGGMTQLLAPMLVPATKFDRYADQLAVIGFDNARRVTATNVFQWSVDRLHLRRTITHANRDGGIVGVVIHRLGLFFADTAWLRFVH